MNRRLLIEAARAAGVPPDKIAVGLAIMEGKQERLNGNDPPPLLLTQAETGRLLSCSRWSVRRLVAGGFLHPIKLRGLIRYKRTDVDQLLVDGTEPVKRKL